MTKVNPMTNLEQENQKLRDALLAIHRMANEGLRTDDGGASYWQIEADAAGALGLTDEQRDIDQDDIDRPRTVHKLYVQIDKPEQDLLIEIAARKAGYNVSEITTNQLSRSIMKLEACEFIYVVPHNGYFKAFATSRGEEFLDRGDI